jgi:hypothetical protein
LYCSRRHHSSYLQALSRLAFLYQHRSDAAMGIIIIIIIIVVVIIIIIITATVVIITRQHRPLRAEPVMRELLEVQKRLNGAGHALSARAAFDLADLLRQLGLPDLDESRRIFEDIARQERGQVRPSDSVV